MAYSKMARWQDDQARSCQSQSEKLIFLWCVYNQKCRDHRLDVAYPINGKVIGNNKCIEAEAAFVDIRTLDSDHFSFDIPSERITKSFLMFSEAIEMKHWSKSG